MSSIFSHNIGLSVFGQSHSDSIGVTIDSFPSGMEIDFDFLKSFMKRRAPGTGMSVSPRKEDDEVVFLCGLKNNITCGAPITAIIKNNDGKREEHTAYESTPRPSHADLTQIIRYGDFADISGGGHLSGRLTAPLCIAGALALQYLKKMGVEVKTSVQSVGGKEVDGDMKKIEEIVGKAVSDGDSVGGTVLCRATGVKAGLGSPVFFGLENVISSLVFAVPGVKAIEFGAGISASSMRGSEYNDGYCIENGEVRMLSNNSGGILGGISTSAPIEFRAFFKPTPSISLPQRTVNLKEKTDTVISLKTRNDSCIALRGAVAVEAACALALLDAYL